MKRTVSSHELYASLTLLASTFPALSLEASGTTKAEKTSVNTNFTHWSENKGRYDIDMAQVSIETPLNDAVNLSLDAESSYMSGASPVFYLANAANTQLVERKTGPSLSEKRNQVSVGAQYFKDENNYGMLFGYSNENDYRSFFFSPSAQFKFNKNNTALNFSYAFANDRYFPAKEEDFAHLSTRPDDALSPVYFQVKSKQTHRATIGVTQDFSKTNYGILNFEFIRDHGFMGDPYKRVAILGGDATALRPGSVLAGTYTVDYDRRPTTRHSYAIAARFVQYIKNLDSSLHLDYRFAKNNWGIFSHTLQGSYTQPFGEGWEFAPGVRYYAQSAASFYAMAFTLTPTHLPAKFLSGSVNSTDYRLSSFGNFGMNATLAKTFWKDNKISFFVGYRFNRDRWGLAGRGTGVNPSNAYNTLYGGLNLTVKDLGMTKMAQEADKFLNLSRTSYAQGTFSIKPLNLHLASITGKFSKGDTLLNGRAADVHTTPTYGLSHPWRNARSYAFEIGFYPFENIELFVKPSFGREMGLKRIVSAPSPALAQAYNFYGRNNHGVDVGLRKYFDLQNRWAPFVGASIGYDYQSATRVTAFSYNAFADATTARLGEFTLEGSKHYAVGELQTGVDYRFTDWLALTLKGGLHMTRAPKTAQTTHINGRAVVYRDHHRVLTFPISMGVKFTF